MYENLDDKKVYELFHGGDIGGISLLDNAFARKALISIKPNNINEIKSVLVLDEWNRLCKVNKVNDFVNKSYECPVYKEEIAKILNCTRGLLMWRNQFFDILVYILGCDLAHAKNVRKYIRLCKKEELITFEKEFMTACIKKGICDSKVAREFLIYIENKAPFVMDEEYYEHLAIITYQGMWWKCYLPTGFANYRITLGGADLVDGNEINAELNDVSTDDRRRLHRSTLCEMLFDSDDEEGDEDEPF